MLLKKITIALLLCVSVLPMFAQQWAPAGDKIKTTWGEQLKADANVWNEYPRPILERSEWKNLNGLWKCAKAPMKAGKPSVIGTDILVPFCLESSLSGVADKLKSNEYLWYKRSFTVPGSWQGRDVKLNFGAVDYEATVWVNGVKVGSHKGGYSPFSFNITAALVKGNNELVVRVADPTDQGTQAIGKQRVNPSGIWYTAVSGIWQTVWIEPVASNHIDNLLIVPNVDKNIVTVTVKNSTCAQVVNEVKVLDNGKVVAQASTTNGLPVEVEMPSDVKLWSPDSPYLYDLEITTTQGGKVVDKVKSYCAMRSFGTRRDADGHQRLTLNGKYIFEYGPLDQGWWPDGLYTAPSPEALYYDIDKTKEWGFNMIRKHVKVEPAIWYAHCDRKGIIVWQDMPSGDFGHNQPWKYSEGWYNGIESYRSAESEAGYYEEWKEIIDNLRSYPCIGMWVPFNEAWGQFKTKEVVEWTKQYDPFHLVNASSGGNFVQSGDVLDLHHYPEPLQFFYDGNMVNVLGEYGGIGLPVQGHTWVVNDKNWGYVKFGTSDEVTAKYVEFGGMLKDLVKKGFSAAVYTQTTDCETEINGIMTYDRKVVKMNEAKIRESNQNVINSLK